MTKWCSSSRSTVSREDFLATLRLELTWRVKISRNVSISAILSLNEEPFLDEHKLSEPSDRTEPVFLRLLSLP